jgi:hypothetical protein
MPGWLGALQPATSEPIRHAAARWIARATLASVVCMELYYTARVVRWLASARLRPYAWASIVVVIANVRG